MFSTSSSLSKDIVSSPTGSTNNGSPRIVANSGGDEVLLKRTFQHILRPQSSDMDQVIAVTLHESSQNEFPCWDDDDDDTSADTMSSKFVQICFFLGAVRDMYKDENRILRQICDQNQIPLLRMRFGPVSEFTSKILSVVSYHASNHPRIAWGCERIIARNQRPVNDAVAESMMTTNRTDPMILQFICHVPTTADAVTTSLNHRHRILWCMVRCTVTCLWRSRLAGGKNNHNEGASSHSLPPPVNRLSFLFYDGIVLTLDQNDLVADMAANHQAAPSEYQILATIRKKLDEKPRQVRDTSPTDRLNPSTLRQTLFFDTSKNHMHCPSIVIDFIVSKDPSDHDFYFYQSIDHQTTSKTITSETSDQVIAICIAIRSDTDCSTAPDATARKGLVRRKIHQAIIDACETSNTTKEPLMRVSGHPIINMDDCVDEEGATITMIQHLAYQGRLFNLCHRIAAHDLQQVNALEKFVKRTD